MANPILRQKLAARQFVTAPGIQDMIGAVIANKVGFDVVYGSGYWTVASAYGLPDAGIASVTQMVDRMATLVRTSNAAVIADADTGFGGLLNVHHTVQSYEQAGITAIQIEDQEFPKKCGHTPGKRVIPATEMADKIRVAVEARRDENFLIIARTDARQSEGLDGVLHRMKLYAEAGADILFPEALTSDEEARTVTAALDKPMMANMADGGLTPIRDAKTLEGLGYALSIFPAMTSLAAAAAMESALLNLKQTGTSLSPDIPLFNFKEFCSLIGFEEVWAFDKKWAR
ncbi:isocitrate lyase/PEP mutase family protein [Niveispirillum sp. KHB5.9]|uniref:isocitrate lyase/PEP mutase family protein n=1 Tax=Niveispirillum sp. KHB5.9 TaxID=3400269 RepID=UPI003A85696B